MYFSCAQSWIGEVFEVVEGAENALLLLKIRFQSSNFDFPATVVMH